MWHQQHLNLFRANKKTFMLQIVDRWLSHGLELWLHCLYHSHKIKCWIHYNVVIWALCCVCWESLTFCYHSLHNPLPLITNKLYTSAIRNVYYSAWGNLKEVMFTDDYLQPYISYPLKCAVLYTTYLWMYS